MKLALVLIGLIVVAVAMAGYFLRRFKLSAWKEEPAPGEEPRAEGDPSGLVPRDDPT